MKKLFTLVIFLTTLSFQNVSAVAPPRVNIDGMWYTNGQTAYIECNKASVNVYIDLILYGSDYLNIRVTTTPNLTVSNTASDIMKTLHLDPDSQNGYIDVGYENNSGDIRVYIQQKPPTPTITVGSNICAGNSASITATSNYSFQSSQPINLVWQTTGGVTVNGSSSYIQTGISSTVTVANISNGTYSVKAVVSNCDNLESTAMNVRLGPPVITNPNYWLFDPGSNMWQFSQTSAGPGVTYSFYVSSGSAILNPQNQDCYISTTGGATVCVSGTNSCGTGTPYCFYIPPAGGFLKTVYPNPATDVLSFEFRGDGSSNTVSYELILFSEKSMKAVKRMSSDEILASESFKASQKLEMNVGYLPRGVYYIHIVPDSRSNLAVQKKRIILE
jgi:hypothetical protein